MKNDHQIQHNVDYCYKCRGNMKNDQVLDTTLISFSGTVLNKQATEQHDIDRAKAQILKRYRSLDQIRETITTNQKGQFEDEAGNICWYLDDLLQALELDDGETE